MKSRNKILYMIMMILFVVMIVSCDTNDGGNDIEDDPVYTISLNETSGTLIIGESLTLTATIKKDDVVINETVTWSSSDDTIASVNNGVVQALSEGTVTISATAKDVKAEYALTVLEPEPEEVFMLISPSMANINVGDTVTFNLELTNGEEVGDVVWTSSDEAVATVQDGVVQALTSGTVTITAKSEDGLYEISAEVVISDVIELIFPELDNDYFVGDIIELGAIVKVNGVETTDGLEVTGTNIEKVESGYMVTGDGKLSITVSYPGASSITRTADTWIKIENNTEFLAIGDSKESMAKKYMLANDLDFGGAQINAFSSWHTNNQSDLAFTGHFNGNGHTIYNFEPIGDNLGNADRALFGYLKDNAIVENTNFIGVIGKGRSAVVSNYFLSGTIRNIYVEMTYLGVEGAILNAANPASVVVGKVQKEAIVQDVVAHLIIDEDVAADLEFFSGIASLNYATMSNVYLISDVTIKDGLTVPLFRLDHNNNGGSTQNSEVFTNPKEFYEANVLLDETLWNIDENKLPYLGALVDEINIAQNNLEIFAGLSVELQAQSKYGITYTLKESIDGVVLKGTTLSIAESVAKDTVIEVIVSSKYLDLSASISITVLENEFILEKEFETVNFKLIDQVSPIEDYLKAHGLVVLMNDEPYDGEVTFISTNEDVVIVENGSLKAIGDGTALVEVYVNNSLLGSLKVYVEIWNPIYTTSDFLAIGTNKETLSKKYVLQNDLDFEGAIINAFSSWTSNNLSDIKFTGHFDGNGYTIANFEPDAPTEERGGGQDRAVFGYLDNGAIVENTNFIGVIGKGRSSVVSNWIQNGIVRNIYVEMTYKGTLGASITTNNAASAIVGKNQALGVVENVIAYVTFESEVPQYFGGVSSVNNGSITNAHIISTENIYGLQTLGTGTITNSAIYASISELYAANIDMDNFVILEDKKPYYGQLTDDFTITNTESEVFVGSTLQILGTNKYSATYQLEAEIPGVTISQTGLLQIDGSVAPGIDIVIKLVSDYLEYEVFYTVITAENSYTITTNIDQQTIDILIGETHPTDSVDYELVVLENDLPYAGVVDITSTNPLVATATSTEIVALGDGVTTIEFRVNDVLLHSIEVKVNAWNPVRTKEDFLAIGTDATTMSKKYLLLNDIDFEGEQINAFSSWHTNNASGLAFVGYFNGNGYTISNFEPMGDKLGNADRALFGYMKDNAIVENTRFIGVVGNGRSAVVANYVLSGVIRNIYVEMTYYGPEGTIINASNPAGALAGKVQANAFVENAIVVVEFDNDIPQYFGAIGSLNYPATSGFTNAHYITTADVKFASNTTYANPQEGKHEDLTSFFLNDGHALFSLSIWSFDEVEQTIKLLQQINFNE